MRRTNVFRELLSSFIGLLVWGGVITLLVFEVAVSTLRTEIMKSANIITSQLQVQMDSAISSLQSAAESLSYDERIVAGSEMNAYAKDYGSIAINNGAIRQLLSKQKDIGGFTEELCVFYPEQNTMITSGYSYYGDLAEHIANRLFGQSAGELAVFLEKVQYRGTYIMEISENNNKILVCHPILSPLNYRAKGAVIAVLSQETIPVNETDGESLESTCLITTLDRSFIYAIEPSFVEVVQANDFQENGSVFVESKGTEYILTDRTSQVSDLRYLMLFNSTSMLQDLNQMRGLLLTLILIGLLIGTVVAYFMTKYHYQPVKKLMDVLEDGSGSEQNEYKYLEETLVGLLEKEKEGEELMAFNGQLIREHLLNKLLDGSIENESSFWEENEKYKFEIQGNRFCVSEVCIVNYEQYKVDCDAVGKISQDQFLGVLQSFLKKTFARQCPIVISRKECDFVCIICMEDKDGQSMWTFDELRIKFEQVRSFLEETLERRVQAALSCEYHRLTGIKAGYDEVQDLIHYANLIGVGDALLTQEYLNMMEDGRQQEKQKSADYMRTERTILNCMLAGNYLEAGSNLAEAIDKYTSGGYTNAHVLYHIINTTLIFLEDIRSTFSEEFYNQLDTRQRINKARTIIEKRDVILDVFEQMSDYMERQNSSGQSAAKHIIDYIDANYTDPNLNRNMIAEHLNMSISSVSHIVKDSTGKTVLLLVHEKRIHEAKKLLLQTEDTLQKIAEDVGYTNAWTLSRVFKSMTGISPGKYRDTK